MNKLKKKRVELNLTQIEAAERCGVSRRTFQNYEENGIENNGYNELLKALCDASVLDNSNFVLNKKYIKDVCLEVFEKYPEIESAYLFGSYARGDATGKSDIDIFLILNQQMGMKYFEIGTNLIEKTKKDVDLVNLNQIKNNENFLFDIFTDGIKIYGKKKRKN